MPLAVRNYKGIEVERAACSQGSCVWSESTGAAGNRDTRLREMILDRVLELNDIEVPLELVDNEYTMMVMEWKHRMQYESMASGGYFIPSKDEMAGIMEEFREEARKAVKTRLVLRGVIETENLVVTREELEEEAKAISIRQRMPIEMVKDFLGEELEPLREDLLVRKAVDFICENAVIR